MGTYANLSIMENTLATSSTSILVADGTTVAQATALLTAALGMSLGKGKQATMSTITPLPGVAIGGTPPFAAQRGQKWLVNAHVTATAEAISFTIGSADPGLGTAGSDILSLTQAEAAALVTAAAAVGLTIDTIRYRNYTLQ